MSIELGGVVAVNDTGKKVLDGLDLSLDDGESIGLNGCNGSGKSTLLNVMMGFLSVRSGSVEIDGNPLKTDRDFQRHRGGTLGMLFQQVDDQLFCPSVEEEVAFGPLNQGRALAEVRVIIDDVLGKVGLDGFHKRIPQKLSGGEKRLVALAAVIGMSPRFLLLDEPTANLDPDARERLIDVLKGLDCGMLVVTHDLELSTVVCDRQLTLRNGRVE